MGYKHSLKVWPVFFDAMFDGNKQFSVRKNDRDYQVGDQVQFREWDPETERFTGHSIVFYISYIFLGGQLGIEKGYCVLGLSVFPMEPPAVNK